MKTVCRENMCVGCMACLEICPKSAIIIKDSLKAYNAIIDEEKCVNCGACHKMCQNNNDVVLTKSPKWYQGWSDSMRYLSASGGVATALITYFLLLFHAIYDLIAPISFSAHAASIILGGVS